MTSQLLHVRFQPEKVRVVGLGFNKINPVVSKVGGVMDNTKWEQSYVRITSFFCTDALESCVQPMKTPTKKSKFLHRILFLIRPFLEEWIILIFHSPVRFFPKAGSHKLQFSGAAQPPPSYPLVTTVFL